MRPSATRTPFTASCSTHTVATSRACIASATILGTVAFTIATVGTCSRILFSCHLSFDRFSPDNDIPVWVDFLSSFTCVTGSLVAEKVLKLINFGDFGYSGPRFQDSGLSCPLS